MAQAETVDVEALAAPAAPGFVAIGVEPTAVARPTTASAVGLSLLSSITDSDSLLPKNYALEVAPYWLRSHPELTYEEQSASGILSTMAQTFAISFATATAADDTVRLGLGLRTLLFKGRDNARAAALIGSIQSLQLEMLDSDDDDVRVELAARLRDGALALQAENRNPVGFRLQVAGAAGASFPDAHYDEGRLSKYGAWVTPAYRWENGLSVLGVLRFLRDKEAAVGLQRTVDFGARFRIEVSDLGLSAEFVSRRTGDRGLEASFSDRIVAIVEYRVRDDLYVTSSFGKNYRDSTTPSGALVAFLGASVRLSSMASVAVR
ncbi:MAG: hypothetical protein OXH52_07040 [Gammaproteobacteria bacterium]|nr:hypothetical protein [Gammaproteobacteria bacterium]